MNRRFTSVVLVLFGMLVFTHPGIAWNPPVKKADRSTTEDIKSRAADCAPASAQTNLELNNVRARLRVAGRMWQDESTGTSAYEVPKGSGQTAIFAGSLWMGGYDSNGQLKEAAAMFGGGNDFWTGPLTTDGNAEIGPDVCLAYDQFYRISQAEVLQFIAWWNCNQAGNCEGDMLTYQVPSSITDWPAHGNPALGQAYYLAPFYDNPTVDGGDGVYDPIGDGDYPGYDIAGEIGCNDLNRTSFLRGDETIWWAFNDKGNIHTESEAEPIGMEIHAQAFSFATNDEINNMTFYNYELINRGTQTLYDTYFAQWVDPDLGFSDDDYVGCDVARGLGYCYNGDAFDQNGNGATGYGANPPAIGVDFFEGPYMDSDGKDNCLCDNVSDAIDDNGIVYDGIGIGYGDTIVDNERYGMRKFVYYNRGGGFDGDPDVETDFANYMRGFWLDGTPMYFGDNAHDIVPGTNTSGIVTDYMFTGDSDPLNWATRGIDPGNSWKPWTEQSVGNEPFDRRFVQSAGPFTLEPGAVNNITVGVVYARAASGDPFESVQALRRADDKAQALFNNCFQVVEAPDPPKLTIQELDKELIFMLEPAGNNVDEDFASVDPTIPETATSTVVNWEYDSVLMAYLPDSTEVTISYDQVYRFQGYQVFQLEDATVGPEELFNADRARLAYQCDFKDGVEQIVNYEFDESINASVPKEKVNGADQGISHSFKQKEDLFAQGDRRLINHKTYYYMAISYAYNNYKTYDVEEPTALDGQKKPYLGSRKSFDGGTIKTYAVIPHIPIPEAMGTVQVANYGDQPLITRIEGQGNGGLELDLTAESEASIVNNWSADHITYESGRGPITVKVIDPLNVTGGKYTLRFVDSAGTDLTDATWELIDQGTGVITPSSKSITIGNEQLFPELGFSVYIEQFEYDTLPQNHWFNAPLAASVEYGDSSRRWLSGASDQEGTVTQNWIRSGTDGEAGTITPWDDARWNTNDPVYKDGDQLWENVLDGTWAPYNVVSGWNSVRGPGFDLGTVNENDFDWLQSVDIVITNDPAKWTRCVVLEMGNDPDVSEGGAEYMRLRNRPSVGKDGQPDGSGTTGMGWFPGYAINLETGERLNMAFGEDSWLALENGRDMQWNPTDREYTSIGADTLWGGRHFVYVFGNRAAQTGHPDDIGAYDAGQKMYENYSSGSNGPILRSWRSCMYVGLPMVEEGASFLATDARVRLRVGKPYESYATTGDNNSLPIYEWGMDEFKTEIEEIATAEDALSLITAVPNPYYGYNNYETNRLDTRVKIVNLPVECTISIYNMSGTLVRRLSKDNPNLTSVDWDLKNQTGIPIAGGTYIIHVDAPGIGEKVVKWFGALRPQDTENF